MRALFLSIAVSLLLPGAGWGQESCPNGRVDRIFIDNHSVFDPSNLPESARLRWAYELTNRLHIRTRPGLIRRELLFGEGDCFDPELLRESARILREFRFIARAEVYDVPGPEGERHVVVDTRDEWSTKLTLKARMEGGFSFEGMGVVEENFLGQGVTVGAFALTQNEQRDLGMALEVPRVGRSGWDVRVGGTRTRVGVSFDQSIIHPFRGEVGTRAFRQQFQMRDDLFAYVLPAENGELEATHITLPLRVERAELSGAIRMGEPGAWLVLGGGVSRDLIAPASLGEVEVVQGNDFGNRLPAEGDQTAPLTHQLLTRESTRINLLVGVRRIEYRTRTGLDALQGVQDVPVGIEARMTAGRSVGSINAERPREVFVSGALRGGISGNDVTTFLSLTSQGRFEEAQAGRNEGFQDILTEGFWISYLHTPSLPGQVMVARAAYLGGWRTTTPFQLTLGGYDGVRGYSEVELPVGRRAVFTLEHRAHLPSPFPELTDLGMTLFGDVGAGWGGDAPFGRDTGWRGALGVGLRLGFPAGSAAVIRADLAFPVGPESSSNRAVFRISAREWVGLLHPFQNLQLARSRRTGLSGDYQGVAR